MGWDQGGGGEGLCGGADQIVIDLDDPLQTRSQCRYEECHGDAEPNLEHHRIVAFCSINFVKELLMTSENYDRIHERAAQHLESFLRRILSAPSHP